jgi:dTDP-glucose 4,6-dehydratase
VPDAGVPAPAIVAQRHARANKPIRTGQRRISAVSRFYCADARKNGPRFLPIDSRWQTAQRAFRYSPPMATRRPVSVVTGGAGFLGSHLTDRLLAEGHRVIAIDNFITGNTANIRHLAGNEDFHLVKHNVSNYIVPPEEKIDYVFHFASPASPIDYLELPIPTLKVGALGTHNSLGLAKAKNAIFILASTSECYGDPLVHPQKEDYWGNVNPIGPRGVYDEAKRFAEAMTMAYHRYHGLDTKIVRIFNTYGPRMRLRDGRVVPAFIGEALTGQPITVFGDGSQTRSFCYCSDLIDGIYRLSQSDFHEPVNIGNPREMTIKQFAEEIQRITGTKSEIVYKPLPVDDPKVRQPDIARAKKILGWEPKVNFQDGITKTIDYFRGCIERGDFGERMEPAA